MSEEKRSYGNDRTTQVAIRVSQEEKEKLHKKALKLGFKSISDMFRALVAAA